MEFNIDCSMFANRQIINLERMKKLKQIWKHNGLPTEEYDPMDPNPDDTHPEDQWIVQ